jgi:hypothetical protein
MESILYAGLKLKYGIDQFFDLGLALGGSSIFGCLPVALLQIEYTDESPPV